MRIEKVFWKSDDLTIRGEVYAPADSVGSHPALIICHGIPASVGVSDNRGYPLLAERFCRMGFLTLIFNFRGTGLSEGNFDFLGWTRDLEGALEVLTQRPEVDQKKIFLMGFSWGGAVSIYIAAHHPELAGLVSCASPSDFQNLLIGDGLKHFLAHCRKVGIIKEQKFPHSLQDWENTFRIVEPLKWADRIPPRPWLILHGINDSVVDFSHAQKLFDKGKGRTELILLDGLEHRLRADELAMRKVQEWLKKKAFNLERG